MSERHGEQPSIAARLLRPAQGPAAAAAAGRAVRHAAAAPRARSDQAGARRSARAVRTAGRRGAPGDRLRRRRASDRAGQARIRAPASSAASRSSTAWPRRSPRSTTTSSPTSGCTSATPATLLDWLPAGVARAHRSALSRSVAEAAALEAALRPGRQPRGSRAFCSAAANSASPPTLPTTPPGRWRACCARRISSGPRSAPTTGAKPWPDFSGTRYEAKAKREGRAPCYLIFRRGDLPIQSPRCACAHLPEPHHALRGRRGQPLEILERGIERLARGLAARPRADDRLAPSASRSRPRAPGSAPDRRARRSSAGPPPRPAPR